MAYLLDPGEGKYRPRRPRAALPVARAALARRRGRHARPRRRRRDVERDRPPRRGRCCASPTRSRRRSRPASSPISTSASSARSCGCSRRWRTAGIRIDREFLDELGKPSSATQCDALDAEIHAHAGEEFNVNSTPQLRTILFEKLGLTPVKKTKTGPSTDADSLQKMADEHPIVDDLLRYREVEKLRSTYADALPPLDRAPTAASTRRSTRPTPPPAASRARRRTCRTSRCAPPTGASCGARSSPTRAAGCSPPTTRRSSCACSRTSPRTPGLIDAFERGADVHTTTAAKVFDVDEDEVDDVPAPLRQGRQLRPRVRHGGLRPRRSGSTSRPTRRARSSTRTSTAFPNVAGVHGARRSREAKAARLHHHDLRPAPPDPRARRPTTSASARWGSAWRRTRRCRAPRPTSSSSR